MNEAEILDYLTTQGIDYEYQRHPAVLTMDEAERLALPHPECEARNLFVRESRTHRYFLLTAHARVDLKAFSRQQGLRSLSFASADELREILRLETGAVTPLALLNAPDVTLYLDEALLGSRIAVHPNTNTATVWLQTADLVSLLRTQCVPVVAVLSPVWPDTSPILREPLNKSAAALSGSFAPTYRFENLEIHKVFLQFPNLNLEQNPSLTALAI